MRRFIIALINKKGDELREPVNRRRHNSAQAQNGAGTKRRRRKDVAQDMSHRDLRVFEATDSAVDEVNGLIDGPQGCRMLHVVQLRRSVQSISANMAVGFGRGDGRERSRFLRIARGEAEETFDI